MKKDPEKTNLTPEEKELCATVKLALMRPIANYDDEKLLGMVEKAMQREIGTAIQKAYNRGFREGVEAVLKQVEEMGGNKNGKSDNQLGRCADG